LTQTDGVKGFFLNNPSIYEEQKGLCGAVFVGEDQDLSSEYFTKTYKDYYIEGLSRLVIYRFGGTNEIRRQDVPLEISGTIAVRSAEDLF
jgi:hypothetical protein